MRKHDYSYDSNLRWPVGLDGTIDKVNVVLFGDSTTTASVEVCKHLQCIEWVSGRKEGLMTYRV
jgi:hypothetical protein